MPRMKIEIVWEWGQNAPAAEQAKALIIDDHLRSTLRANEVGSLCYLEFQTEEQDLIAQALRTAVGIQRIIRDNFRIESRIWINHTTDMLDVIQSLELTILTAAAALKRTRSFLPDSRVAAVRERLENCFEIAAGCGYRRCRSLERAAER